MNSVPFTVLIADDESAIRNGLREIIPWGDYNAVVIDAAADGLAALASIRRNRPDLVIMDIKMPGMDGLEVIRQAREEGLEDLAAMFMRVAAIERGHEKEFLTLLSKLSGPQAETPAPKQKKSGYRCQFCGAIFDERPDVCDTCQSIGAFEYVEYWE